MAGLNTADLIGKTKDEAIDLITRAGFQHHVYREGGKVTNYAPMDGGKKRVVLEVSGEGKVVRATSHADTQDTPSQTDQAANV